MRNLNEAYNRVYKERPVKPEHGLKGAYNKSVLSEAKVTIEFDDGTEHEFTNLENTYAQQVLKQLSANKVNLKPYISDWIKSNRWDKVEKQISDTIHDSIVKDLDIKSQYDLEALKKALETFSGPQMTAAIFSLNESLNSGNTENVYRICDNNIDIVNSNMQNDISFLKNTSFYVDLANLTPLINGIATGKFEILISLFSDAQANNTSAGDLVLPNGKVIEVKGKDARIGKSKTARAYEKASEKARNEVSKVLSNRLKNNSEDIKNKFQYINQYRSNLKSMFAQLQKRSDVKYTLGHVNTLKRAASSLENPFDEENLGFLRKNLPTQNMVTDLFTRAGLNATSGIYTEFLSFIDSTILAIKNNLKETGDRDTLGKTSTHVLNLLIQQDYKHLIPEFVKNTIVFNFDENFEQAIYNRANQIQSREDLNFLLVSIQILNYALTTKFDYMMMINQENGNFATIINNNNFYSMFEQVYEKLENKLQINASLGRDVGFQISFIG